MNAVMLSIRPEWCEKIVSGEKTIEVRKSKPKIETPFKCYIYCTKGKRRLLEVIRDGDENFGTIYHGKTIFLTAPSCFFAYGNYGKVIGEFVCDAVILDKTFGHDHRLYTAACMTAADIAAYCTNPKMYGWHISDLKIYDEPKELSEFLVEADSTTDYPPLTKMKRPPQSWCYVEGLA